VPPARLDRDVVLGACGLVVLTVCGLIAHNGRVGGAERWVFHRINDLPGWLYAVAWPVQQLGNLVAGLVVAVLAAVFRKWRLVVAVVLVTFIDLEPIVKRIVVRQRPGTSIGDIVVRGDDVPLSGQSFPSGHAVLVASLAVVVAPYMSGRWRVLPWVLVAGVCIGRVYVGAHNPLDVIAGVGLGLMIGAVVDIVVHLRLPARRGDTPVSETSTAV
jgi:membrane-associated phospholipid phosphatase